MKAALFRDIHPALMALCALLPAPLAYFGVLMAGIARRAVFRLLGVGMVITAAALSIKFAVEFLR